VVKKTLNLWLWKLQNTLISNCYYYEIISFYEKEKTRLIHCNLLFNDTFTESIFDLQLANWKLNLLNYYIKNI